MLYDLNQAFKEVQEYYWHFPRGEKDYKLNAFFKSYSVIREQRFFLKLLGISNKQKEEAASTK